MKSARASRNKVSRAERALVRFLQDHGFGAERVTQGGAAGGVTFPLLAVDRVVEVKARADGFRELYRWLEERDILLVKADRKEALVVIPLRLAVSIARAAEVKKGGECG